MLPWACKSLSVTSPGHSELQFLVCGQHNQRGQVACPRPHSQSGRIKAVTSTSDALDLSTHPGACGSEKASLVPGTHASHHLLCRELGPRTRPVCVSSFPRLATVGPCVGPCSAEGRQGLGWAWGHCPPYSPTATSACCELTPTRRTHILQGKKACGCFCPVPVGKGPTGSGPVCTHHHIQHVTQRGMHKAGLPVALGHPPCPGQ